MTRPCRHPRRKVHEQQEDVFEFLLGVPLLVGARVTRVCDRCGSVLSDEPNPNPAIDVAGVCLTAET